GAATAVRARAEKRNDAASLRPHQHVHAVAVELCSFHYVRLAPLLSPLIRPRAGVSCKVRRRGIARGAACRDHSFGDQVRRVSASSPKTVVKNPSIMASSSASDIPGNAGKSPVTSTFVRSSSGVYEWVNRAPSKWPPVIVVTIPFGGSSRCSTSISIVVPSG